MTRWTLFVCAFVAAIAYYHFLYPPTVYRRATEQALEKFGDVVTPKPRAEFTALFQSFIADDAKVELRVSLFSIASLDHPPAPEIMHFDKAGFIASADHWLEIAHGHGFAAQLEGFTLADDRQTAAIVFMVNAWADAVSNAMGGAEMRYSTNAECRGEVRFGNTKPLLTRVTCEVPLRMVPRPGEWQKVENPEALKQLLR